MNLVRSPNPLADPLDAVLADIAVNVQLPPGLHDKAADRYEAVRNYAERDGSPVQNLVLRFYPQGSMAIDATISTRGTDDEYDLDVVVDLDIDPAADPDTALDILDSALADYPTAKSVQRQTRCVTIRYADGMHLDLTPAARLPNSAERESHIFHANPKHPPSHHFHVPMNAWGFSEWYRGRTPFEENFAKAYNRRLFEAYAEAEVDEVPDLVPLIVKNTATVALQLLKRFRNVIYAEATGRIPPSVMLSCFAGRAAMPGLSLSTMLIRQARMIATAIAEASARREKVVVLNPVFARDCFTDRWPENLAQQDQFAGRLRALADGLEYLRDNDADLEQLQDWLRERFGSHVVSRSIGQFTKRAGRAIRSGSRSFTPRGGLVLPSASSAAGILAPSRAMAPTPARAHTFMGNSRR